MAEESHNIAGATVMPSRNEDHLAPYALRSTESGGRIHAEPEDTLRSPFELDRHRIIECTAFRRLERKTQVFAAAHHDHFRTRLTHTLEAAQIARCLARHLGVNEDLAEAITLAHDLGHPPFGHAGEAALAEAMADHGGFNHNAHSLRVVDYLEHPFPAFRGLNLTAATLEGLADHATRYDRPVENTTGADDATGGTDDTTGSADSTTGGGGGSTSVEAQIASVADRIAYDCHDLEDAIGAGFVGREQLAEVELWRLGERTLVRTAPPTSRTAGPTDPAGKARPTASTGDPTTEDRMAGMTSHSIHAVRRAVLDAVLDHLLTDVIQTTQAALASTGSGDEAPAAGSPLGCSSKSRSGTPPSSPLNKGGKRGVERHARTELAPVAFSPEVDTKLIDLERFLIERVYTHPEIVEMDDRGREMVVALFEAYRNDPAKLPARFAARVAEQGLDRVICDYVAGMTDGFCQKAYDAVANNRDIPGKR